MKMRERSRAQHVVSGDEIPRDTYRSGVQLSVKDSAAPGRNAS